MQRPFRQDGSVNVIVETPRGSQAKFKYDPETGAMMLSRPLPAGLVIPDTRAADGDPLDVMVLWDGTSFPGVVLPSRLIGLLRVEQQGAGSGRRERNDRLPDHLQPELQLPRVVGRRDRAEGRRRAHAARRGEVRAVEQVERLEPQLDA